MAYQHSDIRAETWGVPWEHLRQPLPTVTPQPSSFLKTGNVCEADRVRRLGCQDQARPSCHYVEVVHSASASYGSTPVLLSLALASTLLSRCPQRLCCWSI